MRALLILETISASPTTLTATAVAEQLGLPKQTVHRICTSLVDEGFLMRDTGGNRLRPGLRLREVANGVLNAAQFHTARHAIMKQLADATRETVNFVQPGQAGMQYRDRVETDWAFRVALPVGSEVPFHCTASGKVFLSTLPPSERSRFVSTLVLEKLTPNTHGDFESLLTDLQQVRKRGYAVDGEEFMEGMVAVAVPVYDNKNRYFGSLAVHGPAQRFSVEMALTHVDDLHVTADKLTRVFFG